MRPSAHKAFIEIWAQNLRNREYGSVNFFHAKRDSVARPQSSGEGLGGSGARV